MSIEVLEVLKLPVESLSTNLKSGGPITVDKHASLPDVLQLLTKHGILYIDCDYLSVHKIV